jgi:glutamyl-tRNA reductase
MHVLCLGLSHRTTPIELRERLHYAPEALQAALARFGCGRDAHPSGLTELVILSTCNRLELYAAVSETPGLLESEAASTLFAPLLSFLVETRNISATEFEAHLYHYAGLQAAEHLARVAAGLDSMILGEPQILGQVTEAYQIALGQGAVGPILSALFHTAIRAGKRARTETAISRNPSTVGSVAVRLAGAVVGDLASARVLILGAGEMADLAVEALRVRGASRIVVVSRTRERAAQLAQRWDAQALTFEQLAEAVASADIVIASTAAPHVLITNGLVHTALAQRPERPLIFIDISVPRNVDPEVSRLPNVHYYDIDDLQTRLNGALAERQQEIPRVEAIAAEEARAFMEWLHGLDIAALIAELRAKADAVRRAEVEKTLGRLPHLNETERQRIEALAESLVNKLLHAPTVRLKAEAGNGHAAEYATAARYLFALDS